MKFLEKLFKKDQRKEDLTTNNFQHVINAYSNMLQHDAPPAGCLADAGKLPYPKETIRKALLLAIEMSDGEQKNALQVGYMELASWQDGVEEEDIGLDLSQIDTGSEDAEPSVKAKEPKEDDGDAPTGDKDAPAEDIKTPPEDTQATEGDVTTNKAESYTKWKKVVREEQERLINDLKAYNE